ncbi:hypothetical protein OAN22_00030 [Alphaproteobacteria bacterium]|nr:hypothetical protein [Alphaproteobacteria bacterium]
MSSAHSFAADAQSSWWDGKVEGTFPPSKVTLVFQGDQGTEIILPVPESCLAYCDFFQAEQRHQEQMGAANEPRKIMMNDVCADGKDIVTLQSTISLFLDILSGQNLENRINNPQGPIVWLLAKNIPSSVALYNAAWILRLYQDGLIEKCDLMTLTKNYLQSCHYFGADKADEIRITWRSLILFNDLFTRFPEQQHKVNSMTLTPGEAALKPIKNLSPFSQMKSIKLCISLDAMDLNRVVEDFKKLTAAFSQGYLENLDIEFMGNDSRCICDVLQEDFGIMPGSDDDFFQNFIKTLSGLQNVALTGKSTDSCGDLTHLVKALTPQIRSLSLSAALEGAALECAAQYKRFVNLTTLHIGDLKLSVDLMKHLPNAIEKMPFLINLSLQEPRLFLCKWFPDPQNLLQILSAAPQLTELTIHGAYDDRDVQELLSGMGQRHTHLESLDLKGDFNAPYIVWQDPQTAVALHSFVMTHEKLSHVFFEMTFNDHQRQDHHITAAERQAMALLNHVHQTLQERNGALQRSALLPFKVWVDPDTLTEASAA